MLKQQQLFKIINKVLKLLDNAGLKCKTTKCSLFTQCVHFLGRVVSKDCIYPDPAKLEKIKQWPKPENSTGIASFFNLCNYYRNLIPSFAHISDALYNVSRLEYIDWTPTLEVQFEKHKKQFVQPRIIRLLDLNRSFILETDNSRTARGLVLKQSFENSGLEELVGFFSRALTSTKRIYGAYELELDAVVRAVEHLRMFLLGR